MKKLYSILLMATALFISGNVKANVILTVDGNEYNSFKNAYNALASATEKKITLTLGTTNTTKTLALPTDELEYDLNGATIECKDACYLTGNSAKNYILKNCTIKVVKPEESNASTYALQFNASSTNEYTITLENVSIEGDFTSYGLHLNRAASIFNLNNITINTTVSGGIYIQGAAEASSIKNMTINNQKNNGIYLGTNAKLTSLENITISNQTSYGLQISAEDYNITLNNVHISTPSQHAIYLYKKGTITFDENCDFTIADNKYSVYSVAETKIVNNSSSFKGVTFNANGIIDVTNNASTTWYLLPSANNSHAHVATNNDGSLLLKSATRYQGSLTLKNNSEVIFDTNFGTANAGSLILESGSNATYNFNGKTYYQSVTFNGTTKPIVTSGQFIVAPMGTQATVKGGTWFNGLGNLTLADGYKYNSANHKVFPHQSNGTEFYPTDYTELANAFSNASYEEKTSIYVTSDLTGTSTLLVNAGQNIELNISDNHVISVRNINMYGGKLTISGNGTIQASGQVINLYGSYEDQADYCVLEIGKGINVNSIDSYGIAFFNSTDPATGGNSINAYGIVITIEGTASGPFGGMSINGNAKQNSGDNLPVVNIKQDAVVSSSSGAAIYAAGYAIWNIEGTVQGNRGIYAKAGELNIDGGTIIATADTYEEPTPYGNGYSGGNGCAIILDSKNGYSAGGMSLEITGDATIQSSEAEGAYALYELKTDAADSKTKVVQIESGTINGNINTTAEVKEAVNLAGSITGGTFTDATIQEYMTNIEGIITPVYNEETGTTSYVVSKIDDDAVVVTNVDLNNATEDQIVKLTNAGTTNLTNDVTCKYLAITAAHTVVIPEGKTLNVGEVVLGADAVIDVQAGGKLIVNGEKGIVAFNSSNIVVETSATKPGIVLISPDATSNLHPKATVDYLSGSYKNGSEFVYDFFGHPMYNGQVESITATPTSHNMIFFSWNNETSTYTNLGYLNGTPAVSPSALNNDFGFNAVASGNAQNEPMTIHFMGHVNGNNNATVSLLANDYTTFSNGYLGEINESALYTAATAWGVKGNGVYSPGVKNGELQWLAYNEYEALGMDFAPMKPIMVNNEGEAKDIDINYNTLVYAPATAAAPARRNMAQDLTKAVVRMNGAKYNDRVVLLQSDEFDANANVSMEKYENSNIRFYVADTKDYDIYGTQDLNNTILGYYAAQAGTYTLSFEKVQGDNLTLVDLTTGARIQVTEDATYTFQVGANETNNARFQVLASAKMPTDVENVEAAPAKTGIYSMTGIYLGEDFSVLPAGIYVVNGQKVVK